MAEVDVRSVKLENKVKKRERFKSDPDHVIKKRLPPRLPRRINDIYVTNKTNHQSQVSRCEKLLDSGESELVIHGLGAAVAKAVNLALQLQDKYQGIVGLSVNTSTVDIVDDLEPTTDQADYDTQTRHNSSVHIRLYRCALLGAAK
ncbi:unnamed protein product [Timema podura]|uniref:Uncharacterized protein n=1 Tax=Timema podura TaxID=61482 RepID=A0ABN7NU31_TIMPD|nr:unnamed protein product [Timema podura]